MKPSIKSLSALLLMGAMVTGCTSESGLISDLVAQKENGIKLAKAPDVIAYSGDMVLENTFANNGIATRAVFSDKWNGIHADCKFDESKFEFEVPTGAVDLTKSSFTDTEKSATEFVIPETSNGEVNFYAFNIPAGAKIYNLGKITGFNANINGVLTFYNVNEMTYTISTAGRHTVINAGTLTVTNYANIGDVYNKGHLVLERAHNPNWENSGGTADIPNDMRIYSNGDGTIEMPDGGDLKAICDIHGTLNVTGNLKIQNSTKKYICGIIATGTVENVDGPLETSYVKADVFSFDGNPIYLLPGGHVDVTTLKVSNSKCEFYGAENSNGLVEATNFEFGNKNDFTHTFSDNIYFKVNGGYVKVDGCYAMGQSHYFTNIEDYLNDETHADEFGLVKDRINKKGIEGSPACGEAWSIPGDNCPKCGHPSHGDTCDECTDPDDGCYTEPDEDTETPDIPKADKTIPNHVEVNLEVEKHNDYLATHLSIHVRAVTDVEVFIPVSSENYCDTDDMAIVQKHDENFMIHGGPEVTKYNINGNEVTLTVAFEESGIRVTTNGINEDVIAYLKEEYNDGITFEVWNYYNDNLNESSLKDLLDESHATVKFLDKEPDLYVNAFFYDDTFDNDEWTGYNKDNANPWDCYVDIISDQSSDYKEHEVGSFYNASPYNWLYYHNDYSPENATTPEGE